METFAENLKDTMKELLDGVYAAGKAAGKAEGGGAEPVIEALTITENGTYTASNGIDGYSPIEVNIPNINTSDATATAQDIDYGKTAYANGVKIIGTKCRREYSETIKSEVVGASSYAILVEENDFLAGIRASNTLFVRVEFDIEPIAYTVVKSWASNVLGGVIPINSYQMNQRFGSDASTNYNTIARRLYDEPASSLVGLMHITENGELRLYAGSSNYRIRPCNYRVIVEW